jgi:hypothetical protein
VSLSRRHGIFKSIYLDQLHPITNTMGIQDFIFALEKNDVHVLQQQIRSGFDVNTTLPGFEPSGLLIATRNCAFECVQLLVEKGANVSITNTSGRTAIHFAAAFGYIEILMFLLNTVANESYDALNHAVNARDKNGMTPLYDAASRGHAEVIRLLIDWGANEQIKTKYHIFPIEIAAENGYEDCIELIKQSAKHRSPEMFEEQCNIPRTDRKRKLAHSVCEESCHWCVHMM